MYFDQRFCSAANLSVPWWDKDTHKHSIIIQSVKRNTAVSLHGLAQRVESLTAVATSSENFFIISASCDRAIGVLTCWLILKVVVRSPDGCPSITRSIPVLSLYELATLVG